RPSRRPARRANSPDLTRRLAHTIKPTGGPAQLETIADAAQLIADLEQWRQARPYWDRCAECSCAPPRPAGRQICGGYPLRDGRAGKDLMRTCLGSAIVVSVGARNHLSTGGSGIRPL